MNRHIFLLLNIWTALKILLAAFLVIACSDWGCCRSLDVFIIPILILVACIQLPILIHGFLFTRKLAKQERHDLDVL
ncbi:hypothetical protein DI392_01030 [Vibrio albus]|uniref:Uncharacterized protein n=1 Tax=Vibrio albus TaxID=2200953 RepID=A0A2U3BDP4_9VIBR|nr:hypothetical protein [Vibrio albus]PWI34893.1 hypothetical protein DI392_01030 [Vibrio albus]